MFGVSESLRELGHEIEFWGMSDQRNIVDDTFKSFATNVDYNHLNAFGKVHKSLSTIYSSENRRKIARMLDSFQPDIAHIHNYNFQLTPSILPELKKRGIRVVQTIHDSQMVCPWHRLYNFTSQEKCTKCVEGSFFNCIKDRCFNSSYGQSMIGAAESYFYHRLSYYNKYLDLVISPSSFLKQLVEKRIRVPIRVVPNFTDVAVEEVYTQKDYVLYFGRISEEKGILELQEIFKRLEQKLIFVGKGPLEGRIESGGSIEYVGPKYSDELVKYVSEAKYVIQPSKWFENCPMTVVESFACGTPVIASNHSGFLELIQDGSNGFLIDFTDQESAVKRLRQLFEKEDGNSMRERCLSSYKKNYSKSVHLNCIGRIYNELLNTN